MARATTRDGHPCGVGKIRGCVWDKVASEWAGKEEWSPFRKRCQTAEDKRDFITFALLSVKHEAMHRTGNREQIRNQTEKGKNQDKGGIQMALFTTVQKGSRFKCVETATLPKNESMVYFYLSQSYRG